MREFICSNCKTPYGTESYNCPECGAARSDGDNIYENVPNTAAFVGENADRYTDIFRKNRDKKVFLHTNWASFFFAEYWFAYRKMYLYGILLLLVRLFSVLAVTFAMYSFFLDDIRELNSVVGDVVVITPQSPESVRSAMDELEAIALKVNLVSIAFELIFNFAVSLFSDCIYCRFINKKQDRLSGGASVSGIVVFVIVNLLLAGVVAGLIIPILIQFIK